MFYSIPILLERIFSLRVLLHINKVIDEIEASIKGTNEPVRRKLLMSWEENMDQLRVLLCNSLQNLPPPITTKQIKIKAVLLTTGFLATRSAYAALGFVFPSRALRAF